MTLIPETEDMPFAEVMLSADPYLDKVMEHVLVQERAIPLETDHDYDDPFLHRLE